MTASFFKSGANENGRKILTNSFFATAFRLIGTKNNNNNKKQESDMTKAVLRHAITTLGLSCQLPCCLSVGLSNHLAVRLRFHILSQSLRENATADSFVKAGKKTAPGYMKKKQN